MRKTILVISNSLNGLYSFRKEVIAAIAKEGYRVVISSPHATSENKESFFRDVGCEFDFTEMNWRGTNPLRDLSLFRKYLKLIRSTNPSVVLTYTVKPNIYGGFASRLARVPQLANITGLGTAIINPGVLQKFTVFMYRLGLRKAKKIFYQNSSIQDFCKLHHIGKSGRLIPGSGVNLEWHTLQNYPAENTKMIFNFIGRVMKDKGVDEFFEMASYIHGKYPQVEFHVLGKCEGRYEERMRKMHADGVIVWHGRVDDVRPFIKESFCTILPSYHEGMANVLLETCATGRPVIASNINGCKEAVEDGVTGFLCEVKNADDLKSKVEHFIGLPYDNKVQMGFAARKKMEREFDRRIVVDTYIQEIKNCTD